MSPTRSPNPNNHDLNMKIITLLLAALLPTLASAFDHSHRAWNAIVSTHVKDDNFDYRSAKSSAAKSLDSYLDALAAVERGTYDDWSDTQKLAYLINLYNAATIDLVLEHYPVKSIRDIGGDDGPWKLKIVRLIGKKITLDQLEHEIIRKEFAEPRIHFAVNCASIGCPPLLNRAYTADQLESQLAAQTKRFLSNRRINHLDGKTLHLSPLFDWFRDDFTAAAKSVRHYVAPYFPESERKAILNEATLKFSEYDWALNDA